MTDRTFTRDELDAMFLPHCWNSSWKVDRRPGEAVSVLDELHDSDRWTQTSRLIFQAPDDGKHYEVYYQQGSTEYQEDTDPWYDESEVKATEVEQAAVMQTAWVKVGKVKKSPYTLNLPSCDDTNTLVMNLTDAEADVVRRVSEQVNASSQFSCQPKLHIQEGA